MAWKTEKLGTFIDRKEASMQTGPFGTQLKASEYTESGIPVINVRNIGFGKIRDEKLEYLGESKAQKLKAHILKSGDIVFGRKGASDRHVLIDRTNEGWIQGSDCLRLRLNSPTLSENFISYYFDTSGHKYWMEAVCSFGATMTSLNQDIVRRIEIPVPPLPLQKKIAAVLSGYDDLIENNKRRIALLEKMAEEIYREWFVRLRFPGHETSKFEKGVPVHWQVKRLDEVLELKYGKSLTDSSRVPGDVPVYGSSGVVGTHNEALVKNEGIIVGRKGNVGRVHWSDTSFFPIDTAYYVHSSLSNYYLFYLLKSLNFLNNDAAVPGLSRGQAYSLKFYFPGDQAISKFVQVVKPMFDAAKLTRNLNVILEGTRNMLLPRLMSGKLSVEDLDIQFPPSMVEEEKSKLEAAYA